ARSGETGVIFYSSDVTPVCEAHGEGVLRLRGRAMERGDGASTAGAAVVTAFAGHEHTTAALHDNAGATARRGEAILVGRPVTCSARSIGLPSPSAGHGTRSRA